MSNIDKVAEVMKAHDLFWYMSGNGWTEPHEEVIRCACGEEFYSYIQTGDGSYDDDRDPDALYRQHLTQALADAGLLMPDLPAPDLSADDPKHKANHQALWGGEAPNVWREGLPCELTLQTFPNDPDVTMYRDLEPEDSFSPAEARQLAYALLAAADYAEVNDDRE